MNAVLDVVVNGEAHRVPPGATLADLLAEVLADLPRRGVAVALNGEVVPRDRHRHEAVADGDVVEVVTAVQGG